MTYIKNKILKNIILIYNILPSSIRSIPSIIYLYWFSGINVKGMGDILAFHICQGKIRSRINGKGSVIGKGVIIKASLNLEEDVLIDNECLMIQGPVSIGRGTNFMFRSEIIGPVNIGRYCAIARKTTFQAQNHITSRVSIQRALYSKFYKNKLPSIEKGGIQVGNDVWIGTQAIILPGVSIGDGAIIGAGSIVTKNVKPYSIVVGIPAIHKKYRFPESIRKQLLEIKWWDWNIEKIRRNKEFFLTDLTKEQDLSKLIT